LRLSANDGYDTGEFATTTLTLDHINPISPGDLSLASKTSETVTLDLGESSSDTNFDHYVIYYKQGTENVTESDMAWDETDDSNLGYVDFNGASTTRVTGLFTNLHYTFKIWAYDEYGNKAASTNEARSLITSYDWSQVKLEQTAPAA